MTVHTIWIPAGMSVEQVWCYIRSGQRVPSESSAGAWVNVDDEGKVLG